MMTAPSPLAFYDQHSLTDHLNVEERSKLERSLATVRPSSVDLFCANLASEIPFQGEFWETHSHEEWTSVALAAFKAGRCTQEHFATTSLYWAAVDEFVAHITTYTCVYLRETNAVTWEVRKSAAYGRLIKDFVRVIYPSSPEYKRYLNIFFHWSAKDLEERILPALEKFPSLVDKCLFLIQMPKTPIEYWGPMVKAITVATQGSLYPFEEEGRDILGFAEKRTLVMPAFPTWSLLSSLYDMNMPILLIPRLGTMTREAIIKDRRKGAHVIGLGMPEVPLPSLPDGRPAGPWAFGLHDTHHGRGYADWFSRGLMVGTDRMIQVLEKLPPDPVIDSLISKLIDGEFMNGKDLNHYTWGDIFQEPLLKGEWEANGSFCKHRILEDMSSHRVFWEYLSLWKETFEEADAVISPHTHASWISVEDYKDLGCQEDVLSLIEIGRALSWNGTILTKQLKELAKVYCEMDDQFIKKWPEEGETRTRVALQLVYERQLLCIKLFQTLPQSESLSLIHNIIKSPLSAVVFLVKLESLFLNNYISGDAFLYLETDHMEFLLKIKDQINFKLIFPFRLFQDSESSRVLSFAFKLSTGYRVVGLLSPMRREFLERKFDFIVEQGLDRAHELSQTAAIVERVINAKSDEEATRECSL